MTCVTGGNCDLEAAMRAPAAAVHYQPVVLPFGIVWNHALNLFVFPMVPPHNRDRLIEGTLTE